MYFFEKTTNHGSVIQILEYPDFSQDLHLQNFFYSAKSRFCCMLPCTKCKSHMNLPLALFPSSLRSSSQNLKRHRKRRNQLWWLDVVILSTGIIEKVDVKNSGHTIQHSISNLSLGLW